MFVPSARHLLSCSALALATVPLAACGGDSAAPIAESGQRVAAVAVAAAPAATTTGSTPAQQSQVAARDDFISHDVAPRDADPAATQQVNKHTEKRNEHLVYLPAAPSARTGHLLLFVGGTHHFPSGTKDILRTAVGRGYHAIAIAYSNNDAVGGLCAASTDDECTGKVREEIITGEDKSPLVDVAPPDAIETRLRTLLAHLRDRFPAEDWGRFLPRGQVDWSNISVAGHSQGAGHAAFLAKRHELRRAVMISGVFDVTLTGRPAPWLYRENRTPVDRQYGFSHVADAVVPFLVANASWDAIGLKAFGEVESVDGARPPYGGSHKLSTRLLPASGVNTHVSTIGDKTTPRDPDGTPTYAPVWIHTALP